MYLDTYHSSLQFLQNVSLLPKYKLCHNTKWIVYSDTYMYPMSLQFLHRDSSVQNVQIK